MALLDDLLEGDAEARDWVSSLEFALSERPDANAGYFDHYASDMGVDPDVVVRSPRTPPLGVHSVGVIATERGWQPGMLVMRDLSPESVVGLATPANSYPSLADFLSSVGQVAPERVGVIGIDPPSDQYLSVHGDLWGTLGLPVRFDDGSLGALTAGHVAKHVSVSATVGDGVLGEVIFSDHRGNYYSPQPCADVAAIRLPNDWKNQANWPGQLELGIPGHFRAFEAYNRSGTGAGGQIVRFAGDTFKVAEEEGAWGNFAMTDPISVEGDSGAIVVAEDGLIAGQVVGGLTGAYSITQVIRYLIEAAHVTPDM